MAKEDPRDRIRREQLEIASAEGLFQDESAVKSNPSRDATSGPEFDSGETFALADGPSDVDLPPPAPVVPPPRATPKRDARPSRPSKAEQSAGSPMLEPSALVEEVWSRSAEWGSTVLLVGAWLTFIVLLVYFGLGFEHFWGSLLTLIVGGMVAVVLSYPILITLERPVRITPEQALRDYYGSLSHHLPHFRRMWLLLSTAGRTSTAYGSFEGFKAYWKDRLASMRKGHAGSMTPLVFEVADFKADKSAGMVRIDAQFTLKVWVRGQRKAGAVHAIPMAIALARGPDRMWYLEDGTLGREGRASRSTAQPPS
jgi:hypothetical protein